MNRTLVFLATFLVIIPTIFGFGLKTGLVSGSLIVGGEYNLPAGENSGNLIALFAHVIVPDGAIVNGHILSFSSDINIRGDIQGGIHALESDVKLRETSHVNGQVDQKSIIHWVMLLPNVVRIP